MNESSDTGMTREDYLRIMMLLAAMESWTFKQNESLLPPFLHEELHVILEKLEREVLR